MTAKKDPSAITVERQTDETEAQAIARFALSPSLQSALTLKDYGKSIANLELNCLVEELKSQVDETIDGDLGRAEAMLTTQAHTLDAIFGNLARRATNTEYLPQFDTFLKLGLRAQSQCRATWETLAAIKNPKMSLNQTNIAQNQQINNVPEKSIQPNKQLEKTDGERLDFGKKETSVIADPAVEALGEIDRTEVP